MSARRELDFEYGIKKDIRNNPIVREVDRERHREMWGSVALGVFLVLVLLFSAWQHFELLRHGYRLEQMQRDRAAENDINRHLRLEMETLRAPQRIEKLATERLGMVPRGTHHWDDFVTPDELRDLLAGSGEWTEAPAAAPLAARAAVLLSNVSVVAGELADAVAAA